MSFALSSGVSGLQAHQKMLDVAGNNLANINTTAFKSSRVTFSELLSETIKKASQPTANLGGTNPQQMGSGVGISGITPNMTQGNIIKTGNPLDMAIEGEGYFVVSDGEQNFYTRAGAFAVDADSVLIDPATGYRIQRIGSEGEVDGFQISGDSNIHVPYDAAMPAKATSNIRVSGNLSADGLLTTPQAHKITSNVLYTVGGNAAASTTLVQDLDQFTGTFGTNGSLAITGFLKDGTALSGAGTSMAISATTTLGDLTTWLNADDGVTGVSEIQTVSLTGAPTAGTYTLTYGGQTTGNIAWNANAAAIQAELESLSTVSAGDITASGAMANGITFTYADKLGDVALMTMDHAALTGVTGSSIAQTLAGVLRKGVLGYEDTAAATTAGVTPKTSTASITNGQIRITDNATGYSKLDVALAYTAGSGVETWTMPGYFDVTTVGGEEVKNVNITAYDTQGGKHVLTGAFVRTDTDNTWDFILTSVTGDVHSMAIDDRRIEGITFAADDGSYAGIVGGDATDLVVTFGHDTATPQTVALNMGTIGKLDGLTQFAGSSTAVARDQDGYEAGRLSTVSINNNGILIGAFSNGIKKNIAVLRVALFQNTIGLESIGGGYFIPSANSGDPVATEAMSGGAGTIHGKSLERSNADVATEFVNMIQAQNGFQANARTIKIANEILRELTTLIR